ISPGGIWNQDPSLSVLVSLPPERAGTGSKRSSTPKVGSLHPLKGPERTSWLYSLSFSLFLSLSLTLSLSLSHSFSLSPSLSLLPPSLSLSCSTCDFIYFLLDLLLILG